MAAKTPIAFIGLGAMGFGMATNLLKEGYEVTGFDVWAPTLERFAAAGGRAASTPAEAVADKEYCVCMVATAQQAQSVLIEGENAAITALPKGAVVLLASTVPAGYVQGLERELAAKGRGDLLLVDCPVSGGATRAAEGTLSIMAGASDAAMEKGKALLQAMADPAKLYIVKGGVGGGSNLKMCHQVLAANQILSASEAMGFADHLGLDLPATAKAIIESEGWSWMFEHRSPRMLDPNFQPLASAVNIIMKDTSIITSEARRANFPSPMTSTAEQVYFTGLGRGFGGDDDSSLIRLYTEGKGKLGPVKTPEVSEEEKLKLVVDLLKGIHLCSAAETIAFAAHVGLDLDQVFDLCINAAGGSKLLNAVGPAIIDAFKSESVRNAWAAESENRSLAKAAKDLEAAVEVAQGLKCPTFLGNQALSLMKIAARQLQGASGERGPDAGTVVKVWLR